MPSVLNIFINFAVGWAHPIPRHIELTRSVLLLLVLENVGTFLKMQGGKRFSRHRRGLLIPYLHLQVSYDLLTKVWRFSLRFLFFIIECHLG